MAADHHLRAVAPQEGGQCALRGVLPPLVFVAPVHAGDDEIGPFAPHRRQIGGHPHGVDAVYDGPRGHGHSVRAVGVIDQRDPQAAMFDAQRMIPPVVGAVGEDPRVADAAAVQLADRRADALRAAVAAVVVGQERDIHARSAQGVGQFRWGAEKRIARVAAAPRQRGLQIDHREVCGVHPRGEGGEHGRVVEPFAAARGLDLREVLHDVAAEKHPHALGRRNGRPLPGRSAGRGAADRREQQAGQRMSHSEPHGGCRSGFPFRIAGKPSFLDPLALFEQFADTPERRSAPDGQQRGPEQFAHGDRGGDRPDARQKEQPPDAHPEIVFALDDERMEDADDEERAQPDGQSREVVLRQKFHIVSMSFSPHGTVCSALRGKDTKNGRSAAGPPEKTAVSRQKPYCNITLTRLACPLPAAMSRREP